LDQENFDHFVQAYEAFRAANEAKKLPSFEELVKKAN
jgi:hypothetical protein